MLEKIKKWASGPFRPGITILAPYLIIMGLSFAFWDQVDTDSYYMMAQGRQILESGIPKFNDFSFYANFKIVVQQYPYCVLEYLASLVPRNLGLWALATSQALLLYHILRKMIQRHVPDPWISTLSAAIICLISNSTYFFSLRPENLTLILLLLECLALDKYKATGRKKWLILLPVLAWLEINWHGSMWPFHFCIYAAYAMPAIWPKDMPFMNPVEDDHIEWDRAFVLAGLSMIPVLFLNPYGIDMILYPVRSMKVFRFVKIIEQQSTTFMSVFGIVNVALIVALVVMVCFRKAKSTSFWMAGGFLFLSCVNYHCSMFLPIVKYFLLKDAMAVYESKKPARTNDLIPNGMKSLVWGMVTGLALFACYAIIFEFPYKAGNPALEPAAHYITENQQDGENIFNNLDIGPMLTYYGVKGIHSDSRPELMLESINGEWDAWMEYSWFRNGLISEKELERYGSVQGYMDYHNIQFIMDASQNPAFPYLQGWLADNPDWVEAELDDPLEKGVFTVWIRADRQ